MAQKVTLVFAAMTVFLLGCLLWGWLLGWW